MPALSYVPNDKGLQLPIEWANIIKCPLSPYYSLESNIIFSIFRIDSIINNDFELIRTITNNISTLK